MDGAAARAAEPAYLPHDDADRAVDLRLAELAAMVAVRRHGRGRDLSRVRLMVGSGGALRHQSPEATAMLKRILDDHAGSWALPRAAIVRVDCDYVLAPVGLLAPRHPAAAAGLVRHLSR